MKVCATHLQQNWYKVIKIFIHQEHLQYMQITYINNLCYISILCIRVNLQCQTRITATENFLLHSILDRCFQNTLLLLICNSYNMGTSVLPEIYAWAQGRTVPECKCVYFRQIKSAYVITNISHYPCRLIAYYGMAKSSTSYAELII